MCIFEPFISELLFNIFSVRLSFFSVLFLILLLGICNYEFFLAFDFFNFFLLTSGFHSFNFFRKDITRQLQAAIVNFVYLKSVFGDLSNKALAERKFHW